MCIHAHGVTVNDIAMQYILYVTLTLQGNTAESPKFPDPLSPCAGDAIHMYIQHCGSRRVWFTRLGSRLL